ncbi:MAG: tRNA (adenosine(37)-N6)-dimethylallyltransferase MiaA [Cryomorphaceae bacterium]|nr:tRNA (adenosine(37)-N6)-dimethylallyltransferase MiaA [Cryomorphaceae bacterium]
MIWVVAGPTASGKTGLAIALAKAKNAEIISFDARQFFREIPIGTAAPTPDEMQSIPHHFVGNKSIQNEYSAGAFARDARVFLKDYFSTKKDIVAVGGSGLYLSAMLRGMDEIPAVPVDVREAVNIAYQEKGLIWLQKEVSIADPEYFQQVDQQNHMRLIRALEVYMASGKPFSSFRKNKFISIPYPVKMYGINWPREELYRRINMRVDEMVANGLEEEVRSVEKFRFHTALKTVGYAEFFEFFDGKCTRQAAIENIKQNTRRYAKRQLTWFRNKEQLEWIEPHDLKSIIQ